MLDGHVTRSPEDDFRTHKQRHMTPEVLFRRRELDQSIDEASDTLHYGQTDQVMFLCIHELFACLTFSFNDMSLPVSSATKAISGL